MIPKTRRYKKGASETWSALILFVFLLGGFFFIYHTVQNSPSSPTDAQKSKITVEENIKFTSGDSAKSSSKIKYSNLHGLPLSFSLEYEIPLAVVIENYNPIRLQQKGLEQASIVYETLAEGGITRFLAIFNGASVSTIGPVRSARPYFIDWAEEYHASLTHVGGSETALSNLYNNRTILDIDEVAENTVVWRDSAYSPPHNAYTSTAGIVEMMKKEGYQVRLTQPRFIFKDPDPISGNIPTITISFSLPQYDVKYVYDPLDHHYSRYNGDILHSYIKPSNILIQFTSQHFLDEEGRLNIQTTGTGKSLVFRDGNVIEGFWEKQEGGITRFYDESGKEIPLNRGQTWIEVVPTDGIVNYF
ncbi:DUF3048 domain-containing protein [Candidatus Peregrinibacteria bacterium CG_4_10_14_0_2_um_filter_43_11]|nr:MAG: DUF3048 domain-containing protein [Candidatus Peregrinibacteria bacterium CG_4_10_14_0_2_um_filter_43_11]